MPLSSSINRSWVRNVLLWIALLAVLPTRAQVLVTDQSLQAPQPVPGQPYHFDASGTTMSSPIGQEFTPALNGLDFVDVSLEPPNATNTGTFQIAIHKGTITSPVL